ncbi:putative alpha beta hydrolase fold-containing protein [Golovinomyces cichoracearum]|uniref:Putative alpha beta hydrolase fold-containing protein n=1 Tax=Golovinomyces cichoracearum TaxID=62708 RepID=A0A420GGL8_9PEZI|nr:putative alpha beta hydrolase fold-containing protein [Golovinomyces cichoracearum]
MEPNTVLPTSHRTSADSWQSSSINSNAQNVSGQIRLQPTSSEVISNLITSLSSMPALTAQSSDHPVVSPLASPPGSPNSTSPFNLSGQNNNHSPLFSYYDNDILQKKYSSNRRVDLDLSPNKITGKIFEVRSPDSLSALSELSSPESPSFFPTAINSSLKDEPIPSSRHSDVINRKSVGNLSAELSDAPTNIERKSLDDWSRKRVVYSRSKEHLRDREQVRKDSVNTTKSLRNPTRPSNERFSLMSEETANRELEASKSNKQIKSWGLSIPVRQSSLLYIERSSRPLFKSNPCITADDNNSANEESKRAHMKQTGRDSATIHIEDAHELPSDLPHIISKFPNENSSHTLPTPQNTDRDSRPESSFSSRKSRLSRPASSPRTNTQSRLINNEQNNVDDRPSSAGSIDEAVEAYLCAPRLSQKIKHPQTGRVISFSEVGDSEGFAVFCCVGMGLTRYVTAFYDELASTLKLRLITPDRPGVGDSQSYNDGTATPLSWPDDVYAICQSLKITKFSLLAHSAGAIYALATALRMPHHIRGRIHLLAPWIPPSQMNAVGGQVCLPPNNSLPTSQRILRVLPTPILKAANSSFISATSNSLTSSLPKQRKIKRTSTGNSVVTSVGKENTRHSSLMFLDSFSSPTDHIDDSHLRSEAAILVAAANSLAVKERQMTYQSRLTQAIWDLATQGANPAIDLLICLERRHTIGFRYVDITRAVVIYHGSKDTRVPVENVLWMGKTMRRCDVRVLEGEGHSLMASASIMSCVLTEIAKEWEDWIKVTSSSGVHRNDGIRRTLRERASLGAFR